MISRRSLLLAAGSAAVLAGLAGVATVVPSLDPVTQARAGEMKTWDAAAFAAAQAEGRPILVEIHATWCTVCARQRPIIGSLAAESRFADMVIFTVDYDSQKDVVRSFGATRQGTLIAFNGADETGRLVYESREDRIEAVMASAI